MHQNAVGSVNAASSRAIPFKSNPYPVKIALKSTSTPMLSSAIGRIVGGCLRYRYTIIALSLVIAVLSGYYAATHFAINTDINKLISPNLDWRKQELSFAALFPGPFETTTIVVDAPTPELVAQAASTLTQKLSKDSDLFHSVNELGGGSTFFARNGLLFQPLAEVEHTTQTLADSAQLIVTLARDPSLRGLTQSLSFVMTGIQGGLLKLDDITKALNGFSDTIENVSTGTPFSWHELMNARPSKPDETRRFIEARPILDFAALEPGRKASDAIREAARELPPEYGTRVRLTGPVPISDEEFSTIQQGALVNGVGTLVVVLTILWLALRSGRIILAVSINLFVGLAATAALGLMMVGSLNLISVAFAVLFVGLGVDFGIQFAVRYRSERHDVDDLRLALVRAGRTVGAPLTLAAAAVAAGFLSFLPTDYRGVSELGQIAGAGMLIAFATSITLLPCLLSVLNPPGEPEEIGYSALAPVDRFLERHRILVVGGTGLVALLGLPLLYFLTFDFNPIDLRNPNVESVATFLDLRSDPNLGANAINVVEPSLAEAVTAADRLNTLPEVAQTRTLRSFVPEDQARKLKAIQALDKKVGAAVRAEQPATPPTDAEKISALKSTADLVNQVAGTSTSPGATAAKRLAADLSKLAQGDRSGREKVEATFVAPLKVVLSELRDLLQARTITQQNLPPEIVREWLNPDKHARVEVLPKGDPNDNEVLRAFARSVLAVYPNATGGPISILQSGETIVRAFLQAGAYSLISIALLLWIVLRRFGDVLLTLVPLLLAGLLSLEICVVIGMPLNFANIIALPLLLGVGVAFKIYYITAWRAGQTNLLQSSLTRAVLWSALTTATAFGSLWLSNHPGTSSMGKLLALSLMTTLCAAVLFQPALMGKPRTIEKSA
jgi:hopanoid biosynthesis associated RND transporter like protein HpnN